MLNTVRRRKRRRMCSLRGPNRVRNEDCASHTQTSFCSDIERDGAEEKNHMPARRLSVRETIVF